MGEEEEDVVGYRSYNTALPHTEYGLVLGKDFASDGRVLPGHDLVPLRFLVHLLDPRAVHQEGVVQDVKLVVPHAENVHLREPTPSR